MVRFGKAFEGILTKRNNGRKQANSSIQGQAFERKNRLRESNTGKDSNLTTGRAAPGKCLAYFPN